MLGYSTNAQGFAARGLVASIVERFLLRRYDEKRIGSSAISFYFLERLAYWLIGPFSGASSLFTVFSDRKSPVGPMKYRRMLIKWDPTEGSLGRLTKFLKKICENRSTTVFTRRGSPLALSLAGEMSPTLIYLRQGVPYPSAMEGAIIAAPTTSQMISLINRIRSSSAGPLMLVIDNLTDLTMILGLKKTYELLRELMDSVDEDDIIAGILVVGAQTKREETLLRSLFPEEVVIGRREKFFRLF